MTSFTLSFPPSSNSLFRNNSSKKGFGKRHKTSTYLKWITEAGWQLKEQRVIPLRGAVELLYELQNDASGKRLWDYTNREKAVTDLLVEHGIIEADHRLILKKVTCCGTDDQVGVRVTITPFLALCQPPN